MDRQDLRGLFAKRRRMGLILRANESHLVRESIQTMCNAQRRDEFRRAMQLLPNPTGASKAAEIISTLAEASRTSFHAIGKSDA